MLGDKFNVSQNAVNSTSYYFEHTLTHGSIPERNIQGVNGYYVNRGGWDGRPDDFRFGPSAVEPLYNSTDLDDTFASLAESMSNVVRAGGDGKIRVMGESATPVTRFNISWPWLTLPAVVILLAVGQLLITMWTSRNAPLWKASTLATMSRGPYIGDVLLEAETVQDMHKAVEGQAIHLFSHTAPGGVAAVANSRHSEKDDVQVCVAEIALPHVAGEPQYQGPPRF